MIRPLNKILVIDVESTCWAQQTYQQNEIIEIGMCELILLKNNMYDIKNNRSVYIKPLHSEVSEFCTELTGLTKEYIDKHGIMPEDAYREIYKEYGKSNTIWASYGDYDRKMFERMSTLYNIKYPLGRTHLNVKTLFALSASLDKEAGLGEAVRLSGRIFSGTQHCGMDDAYNITKILQDLLIYLKKGR